MFATATRNFVDEVDDEGLLVPVSSLNDDIELLTVVVKRKRFWFWQRPKHRPTDFTLNDLIVGEEILVPVKIQAEFLTYSGTFEDNKQGSMEASYVQYNMSMQAKDSSKLKSCFGSLKKEEVNVQKLLQGSKNRMLDMSHCLIHQTKGKPRQVLGIVKERIVTTKPCSVIEEVQQGGQCGGGFSTCGPQSAKVTLKENGNLSKDSNVSMEIPTHTTIAYSLLELEIKHSGFFELCLMSDTDGGFDDIDSPIMKQPWDVFGAMNSCLSKDLKQFDEQFKLLSSLPDTTRSSGLRLLADVIQDPAAVGALDDVLEQVCQEMTPVLDDVAMTKSQKQNTSAVLDLMGSAQTEQSSSVLAALHLVCSALDEMSADCLAVLGMFCNHSVLKTMELLVQCVSGKQELQLSSTDLKVLTKDVYEKTELLFQSSNISLKRDGDTVRTEVQQGAGHLPLVLCIVIRGLNSLTV